MPQRKSLARSAATAGKKVLAADTTQRVIGAVADEMEAITLDKADEAAEAVKEKAARAAGRRPPSPRKRATRKSTAKRTGTRKSTAKRTGTRKSTAKRTGTRKSTAKRTGARKSTAKRPGTKKKTGTARSANRRR